MDQTPTTIEDPRFAGFVMQRHKPQVMDYAHTHGHVEILLPVNCRLFYMTQLGVCAAPDGRLCVLWGQAPHRVTKVKGDGEIIIANLPLAELLSWSMPEVFLAQMFAGQLVVSPAADPLDPGHFSRWHQDYICGGAELTDIARLELQLRLRRQSAAGWRSGVFQPSPSAAAGRAGEHVQTMIRYIAENYRAAVTVSDVAARAGVSKSHAMGLFQKTLGVSIKAYLTNLRLHHARTALVNNEEKILNVALDSGFGSLSRFYEAFTAETGVTPRAYRRAKRRVRAAA